MIKEEQEELFYQLALTFVAGIGAKTGRALLQQYGSAAAIFNTPLKELRHMDGLGEVKVKAFKEPEVLQRAEKELAYLVKHNVQSLYAGHHYPKRLDECSDAPTMLYYKGNADLDAVKIVAVVGTRRSTDYGHKLCEDIIEGLQAQENILVVSGLAAGIDSIAHKRCVQLGLPTVGVLGHGLEKMYPAANRSLAAQMVENGGLLTEFSSDTIADPGNFPMRNRIVAGMSDVTIVVESNKTGGALITARMASGYNREVAAFPGRVNDSRSTGCNELIRTNTAAMITCADDLLELMNWNRGSKQKPMQRQLFLNFTADEQKIVDLLQTKDSIHSDELYHHTGFTSSMLAATLLQLEMQGIIKSLPGKNYRMS